jgi:hypothetical protein
MGRAANFIVLCDFVSARVAARLLPRPLAGTHSRSSSARAGPAATAAPPDGHRAGKSTYCFRLITNANLTSITGPYTSRTSIVIS